MNKVLKILSVAWIISLIGLIVSLHNLKQRLNQEQINEIKESPTTIVKITPKISCVGEELIPENIFCKINQIRQEHGLTILKVNKKLTVAAQGHANDMSARNYFSHTTPEGVTFWDAWVIPTGYRYTHLGENLAKSFTSVTQLTDAWMASPEHKENILNPIYEDTGVAISGKYIVQIFGKSQ